jgi:Tfp pilus assembly protein PilO
MKRCDRAHAGGNVSITLVVGVGLLVVAAFIGFQFIYNPRAAQVQGIQNQIRQESLAREQRKEVAQLLDKIAVDLSLLAPEADPAWLAREALALASDAGIRVNMVNQKDVLQEADQLRLSVAIDGSGTYHQLGKYIDLIERSKQFMWVERMDVRPLGKEGGVLSIQMVISSVYVPPLKNG